jgi:hypothetical protein
MATVTPVYNWPVPTSTDYVKDGATAIESLGDAIDSSLNSITSGKNVGLVQVASTTFTSTNIWALDNCFSSAFTNYRVVIEWTANASAIHAQEFRFRAGGVAQTATNYFWAYTGRTSGGTGLTNQAGSVNYLEFAQDIAASSREFTVLDIRSPFTTRDKGVIFQTAWQRGSDGTFANNFGAGYFANATVCDGFQIMASSTFTTTGKVRVYGYRD